MSTFEILNVFKCMKLESQEERDSILAKGCISIYEQNDSQNYKSWISNTTNSEGDETSCQIGRSF